MSGGNLGLFRHFLVKSAYGDGDKLRKLGLIEQGLATSAYRRRPDSTEWC